MGGVVDVEGSTGVFRVTSQHLGTCGEHHSICPRGGRQTEQQRGAHPQRIVHY
jgi:hypothetical protein